MQNDRLDRAKQFMPFDALKGFREAIREKEKIIENKNISLYRLIFFVREKMIPASNIKTKDISNMLLKKLPTLKNPSENFRSVIG